MLDATLEDFTSFRLHPHNLREIAVTSGCDPDIILATAFDISTDKLKVEVDGELRCLFGIIGDGGIWFFFEEKVNYMPHSFFKESRQTLRRMANKYGTIHGLVYEQNPFAIKWAEFMGFEFHNTVQYGDGWFLEISFGGGNNGT